MKRQPKPNTRLSWGQFALLRLFARRGQQDTENMQAMDNRTLGSLLRRGILAGDKGESSLTTEGLELFETYAHGEAPARKEAAELSNLVRSLLRTRRRRAA